MIARKPHPVFAFLWGIWYGCVVAALFSPHAPGFGLWTLIAFLPIEGVAVAWNNGTRDTLSEIETWVIKHLAKPTSGFMRGWNAMLLAQVITISTLFGRTVAVYSDSLALGWALGALVTVWLYDHWTDPARHG